MERRRGGPRELLQTPMRGWAVAAAAVLLGSACRNPSAPAPLRIAHEADVVSTDPIAADEAATVSVLSNVYEGLVAFDRDMKVVPALALSWSTPDEKTWVLRLRPGVRFHDGSAMTAGDVRASILRSRDDATSSVKGQLFNLARLEAPDASTLSLKTSAPDPLLLNRLAQVLISRPPSGTSVAREGTGPYRIVGRRKAEGLEVAAFPDYWGGRPSVDRVVFVPVVSGEKAVSALRRREVDVLRFFPDSLLDEVRSSPWVRIVARPGLTSYYLWFDTRPGNGSRPNPFADRRVRQAVSLAMDRRKFVSLLRGGGLAATHAVPRGVFGHVSGVDALRFDGEEARRLLREAGYPGGFATTLATGSGTSQEKTAEMIREMLERVGIRLSFASPAWPEMVAAWKAGRLPFFLSGWRFENGDAASFLRECLLTRNAARTAGAFNAGFSDPVLDALVEENERTLDSDTRLSQYRKVMDLVLSEMPVVPLYSGYNLYGVSDRVRWEPRLDGKLLAAEISLAPR